MEVHRMQTQAAKLSSKGNIAIPKEIIARRRWKTGQKLDDVAGMLRHSGKTVSLKEMEEAVRQGAQERYF
jgi:hypothetical protein